MAVKLEVIFCIKCLFSKKTHLKDYFYFQVMIATEEEMNSAKVHPKFRDYCAHKYIEFQACLKNNRPFYWRCKHERHEYGECEFEDAVLRMKEWERERRLREREKQQERNL